MKHIIQREKKKAERINSDKYICSTFGNKMNALKDLNTVVGALMPTEQRSSKDRKKKKQKSKKKPRSKRLPHCEEFCNVAEM